MQTSACSTICRKRFATRKRNERCSLSGLSRKCQPGSDERDRRVSSSSRKGAQRLLTHTQGVSSRPRRILYTSLEVLRPAGLELAGCRSPRAAWVSRTSQSSQSQQALDLTRAFCRSKLLCIHESQ